MQLRILVLGWFGNSENSGGMEVHVREICGSIAGENARITLVVPKGSKPGIKNKNIRILEILCKAKASSIGILIKNVLAFNKNISKKIKNSAFPFDIIHSHDWLCVAAAKELKRKYRKPWVHTVHSLEHIRAGEETRSGISRIEKEGVMLSDKIITVSNLMKTEITKKYKVPRGKVAVIRNYLSIAAKNNAYPEKINRDKNVLYAGRLALQKGVETLISAFPKVLEAHPDAKLIIAGEGKLKKSLIAFSKIKGIEKTVVFKGHVSEKSLSMLYSQAAVFVSPSNFEPFGITVLDAAHFGAPIIATKNTGALEIFGKESVATIPAQNSIALAEKIISLLNDKGMQKRLAKNAKKDLEKTDGWKDISEKTFGVYEELLD